jgi:trk system potassium uptake protein TrkH
MPRRRRRITLRPTQVIVLSILLATAAGWLLLLLPAAVEDPGRPLSGIDALFTSTTAVCVTGLSVLNVGQDLSTFGHAVVLLLIQVGGIFYMLISTVFMLLLGQRLRTRMVLREAMGSSSMGGVWRLLGAVMAVCLVSELIGAVLLTGLFHRHGAPVGLSWWLGVFHSVSAFCNAGLDLFGRASYGVWFGHPNGFSSLAAFADDPLVLTVVAVLIVVGGLGFLVLLDLAHWARGHGRLTVHSRIVCWATVVLILGGTVAFVILEGNNLQTFGRLGTRDVWCGAMFQSVTARTAGFSTIDVGRLHASSNLLTVLLMLIGASPGGTGGGVKTTTFVIVLLAAVAAVRGDDDVTVFDRYLSHATVYRALAVLFAGTMVVVGSTFALTLCERPILVETMADDPPAEVEPGPRHYFSECLFEATSAFGTVGLSTGLTPDLSKTGKLAVIVTMLLGRIGPVTLGLALAQRRTRKLVRHPEGSVMIG